MNLFMVSNGKEKDLSLSLTIIPFYSKYVSSYLLFLRYRSSVVFSDLATSAVGDSKYLFD